MIADDGRRLREVAGVGVHLAAAGLALGEDDLVAEALQDGDGGLGGLGEHGVRQTRREQGDAHG